MVRWVVIRYPGGRRWLPQAEVLSPELDTPAAASKWRRDAGFTSRWVTVVRIIDGKLAFLTSDDDQAITLAT